MPIKLSSRRCQCAACGKFFSGGNAFDRHRVGKIVDVAPDYGRRCMDDGEMVAAGMKIVGDIWKIDESKRKSRFDTWLDIRNGASA